ncbi:hypothetical protein [Streptomyces sp. DH37]|uniref:hypothetical protein n=1 Tax=Streptomyces sp. DH37 TaxID=3040122 RepID=UPI0024414A11|nr:hypothetical protein [Streptomyces sp. DH37]MDG9705548.1 hypothetical protein [Streptomyces sp. DH37]
MALDPLATVADLTARGLTVDASETAIAGTCLDIASALVREAAGVPISQLTSTVAVEGVASQWLTLPGAPVTDVSAVAIDGETVTDWRLRSGRLWRRDGWSHRWEPSEVEATYTHGLAEVPADIVDMVCRLAAASLLAFRDSGADGSYLGARVPMQERIGDYSATYAYAQQAAENELLPHQRQQLRARFGGGAAVVRSR